MNKLFLMDNIEGMKQYHDNYFDLAIIDPPYGINVTKMSMGSNPKRNENGQYPGISTAVKVKGRLNTGSGKLKNKLLNTSEIDWDNEIPSDEFWKQLFRVSKNQIIWGGNYFNLPPTRCFIIWNKNQPWENFSQAEFAWTNFDNPAKLFTYSNRGGNNEEQKFHPTQKPIYLYDYCLKHFAKPGMKILDTHVVSGGIRISCDKYGVDFIGFETNKYYFDQCEKRYNEFKNQLKLF